MAKDKNKAVVQKLLGLLVRVTRNHEKYLQNHKPTTETGKVKRAYQKWVREIKNKILEKI